MPLPNCKLNKNPQKGWEVASTHLNYNPKNNDLYFLICEINYTSFSFTTA